MNELLKISFCLCRNSQLDFVTNNNTVWDSIFFLFLQRLFQVFIIVSDK